MDWVRTKKCAVRKFRRVLIYRIIVLKSHLKRIQPLKRGHTSIKKNISNRDTPCFRQFSQFFGYSHHRPYDRSVFTGAQKEVTRETTW